MVKVLSKLVLVCFLVSVGIGPAVAEIIESGTNETKSFISAETRIRGLAIKNENSRKSTGMMLGGAGGLFAILGIYFASRPGSTYDLSPLLGILYIAEGVFFIAMGVASYFIPTGIENDYMNIDKLDKTTGEGKRERELLAEKSLKNRSLEAANGRIWGSTIFGGVGAMYLAGGGSSSAVGVLYGGLALYVWNNKSDVEKEYDEYIGDKELLKKELSITPMINEVATTEAK